MLHLDGIPSWQSYPELTWIEPPREYHKLARVVLLRLCGPRHLFVSGTGKLGNFAVRIVDELLNCVWHGSAACPT